MREVALLRTLLVLVPLAVVARRIEKYDSADVAADCECLRLLTCSSCSFAVCPFKAHSIKAVRALTQGGTDKVNGVAAWKVVAEGGAEFALKFGGRNQKNPVRAAQLAHNLGVLTPRQLIFDMSSCKELWEQGRQWLDSKFKNGDEEAFRLSLDQWEQSGKQVVLQEWASSEIELPEEGPKKSDSTIAKSIWYQAGGVAAFDWLIGKGDLFNDVNMNFASSPTTIFDTEYNWGNLIFDDDVCIEIDLDIGMRTARYDYLVDLLQELKAQEAPATLQWIEKVMLPMMSLIKSGGDQERPLSAFKAMSGQKLSGYRATLSPLMVQLGMVDTFLRALALLREGSALVKSPIGVMLPGFTHVSQALGENAVEELQGISDSYTSSVQKERQAFEVADKAKEDAKNRKDHRCCKVTCSKKRDRSMLNWYSREACGGHHHAMFKLKRTHYLPGSRLHQVYGDPYENSCSDVFEKRSLDGTLCGGGCSQEARKPKVTSLEDASFEECNR